MAEQRAHKFQSFSAAELRKADPKPPTFIIDEILPAGLVVFAAPPKSGKSWLCLAIADAVAEGQTFWGLNTARGDVLYLALEDSGYRLNERLQVIGSRTPTNLHIVVRGAELIEAGFMEQLESWVADFPSTRLIIIDTVGRIKSAGKPGLNAYESDTAQYGPIQQFATKHGLCIMAVSHFSKIKGGVVSDPFERITGSTGLFGVADGAWILYGKRGEEQTTLRVTGRDITDAQYRLKFVDGIWTMQGISEALERQEALDCYRRSPLMRTIVALVNKNSGRWLGTSSDLLREVLLQEKNSDVATVQEIGKKIQANKGMLLEQDHIGYIHSTGGRRGRGYAFMRV